MANIADRILSRQNRGYKVYKETLSTVPPATVDVSFILLT